LAWIIFHTQRRDLTLQILNIVRIAAWCLAATIVVLSLVPPQLRPETGAPPDLEHFVIYAITGLAFSLGYERKATILAFSLVIFAGCVELSQLLVPGRHARLSDFIVDALAMCFGVGTIWVMRQFRGRI
jgi:VanZ family protein